MKLIASLYLDEDVSVLLAALLRARGIDVTTARDERMLGRPDPEQFGKSASLERVVVTHNRSDFEKLHTEYIQQQIPHFGVIVAQRRDVYELARRVGLLLDTLTADEMQNQLLYI